MLTTQKNNVIRSAVDQIKATAEPDEAAKIFANKVLSQSVLYTRRILVTNTIDNRASFPPVLHEWFIETFPEPSTWLASRTSYSRTAAVMSMVGYILG